MIRELLTFKFCINMKKSRWVEEVRVKGRGGMIGDVGGTKIRPRPTWGQKCLTLREEGWF